MVKEPTPSPNIKKKRKTTNADNEQDIDIYKKVVNFEEKESLNRKSEADAAIYFQICKDVKSNLAEIFERKCDKNADQSLNKESLTNICVKLCFIKKLNRIDKIKHVLGKETLIAEKQKCDSIKLTYQNLVYELHHLVGETNKCLAFKSKDEDIELVSFEDFMKEAPKSLTEKFKKFDENDTDEKHSLRLARLEWELTQRKSLAELCKSLVEDQKKLRQDLVERREKLNALRPLLTNIINATKPLQEHLNVPLDQTRSEHKLAFLLPDPLYIFYVNIISYKSVYDLNLNVDIVGDKDDAVRWKESREVLESGVQNDDDTEPETDLPEIEEAVEVKKRRHRKSTQPIDPMEEKKKKLLEFHPLAVEITAKLNGEVSLIATFWFYTRLKIITVVSKVELPSSLTAITAREILSGENILGELIKEGDLGLESPNPTTPYQLKKVGILSYQSLVAQVGHAYSWAQGVCGMDFLTKTTGCDKIGGLYVENVVKVLFKRLAARYNLAKQLQQLEQNIIPKVDKIEAPANVVSTLTKWSSTTYQKFCQSDFTRPIVDEDLILPTDMFFSANFNRGSANLQALIVVKNSYPEVPPIFSLCLDFEGMHHSGNSDDIRDMERSINAECECGESSAIWLLSTQITFVCSYLDVYLETLDSKMFPQSSMFLKNICARNRKRPFKFRKVGTGIFTQY